MKQSEYIPISVRQKIENKDAAKIVDYLEKNATKYRMNFYAINCDIILDKIIISLGLVYNDFYICVRDTRRKLLLKGDIKLLADNIVGIWGTIKNL